MSFCVILKFGLCGSSNICKLVDVVFGGSLTFTESIPIWLSKNMYGGLSMYFFGSPPYPMNPSSLVILYFFSPLSSSFFQCIFADM